MIFIKENISEGQPIYDESDSSVARSRFHFEELFEKAGLEIVHQEY
jgi:AdoMet dependent proline di-methyltransferase